MSASTCDFRTRSSSARSPFASSAVLERALVAPRDEQDVVETRGHGFLDDVLDGRLVDDRQHLLGRGLRRR